MQHRVGELSQVADLEDGVEIRPLRVDESVLDLPHVGLAREVAAGQFVACHFPLSPGETMAGRNGQTPSA